MQKSKSAVAMLLACSFLASVAYGQTGPAKARMLSMAMTSEPLPQAHGESSSTEVELAIDATGRVGTVDIRASSGDQKYDEKVRRYYSKMRFIPALDAAGVPIASTMITRLTSRQFTTMGGARQPDVPAPVAPASNPAAADDVEQEVRRIGRMQCKDFLWEYDVMKDIAGSRPIDNEAIFRTLQAMYLVQEQLSGPAVSQMRLHFSDAVRASVDHCRKATDEKYFQDVLVPTLKAKLTQ